MPTECSNTCANHQASYSHTGLDKSNIKSSGPSYRRLADALNSGVTSLATRHAVEALHALATHLPTSRDLILATGAVAKLVTLLRDSYSQAHYSMLKVGTLPHDSRQTSRLCKLFMT